MSRWQTLARLADSQDAESPELRAFLSAPIELIGYAVPIRGSTERASELIFTPFGPEHDSFRLPGPQWVILVTAPSSLILENTPRWLKVRGRPKLHGSKADRYSCSYDMTADSITELNGL